MNRPITTLFMLMSVDGKISTGATDVLDFDKDLPTIEYVRDGLQQYYDIERTTDLWSLCSGRTQAKIGANERTDIQPAVDVSFAIIDNSHMRESGLKYFCAKAKKVVIITSNPNHPAYGVVDEKLNIIYQPKSDMLTALRQLHQEYGCEKITIQTGGTLNGLFLRQKLIDYVDVVVAPILVGGKEVSTLIDGESIMSTSELWRLGALRIEDCTRLNDSYIRLRYKVMS